MHFEISHAEHRDRYGKLQEAMGAAGIDTLLSWAPENIYYLSGFDSQGYYYPQCLVVSVDADPVLVVRHFETPNVELQTWLTDYVGYQDHEDVAEVVASIASKSGSRIGMESDLWSVSPAMAGRVAARLDQVTPLTGLVEGIRMVKSPAEIALIRQACRYTEAGMAAAFEASVPGATEDDVAAACYHAMISSGSSYPSLAPFIATGVRTSEPHATWSGRSLQQGDMLFYEPGGTAARYGAAIIRCGVIGEAAAQIRHEVGRASSVLEETLQAVLGALRPGATGQEIHKVNRDMIMAAGYGDVHRNRTGYSLGISYPPDWGEGHIYSLRHGETRPLIAGMTFHVALNIMSVGVIGVGTSETVLITPEGCEVLTQFPRCLVRR